MKHLKAHLYMKQYSKNLKLIAYIEKEIKNDRTRETHNICKRLAYYEEIEELESINIDIYRNMKKLSKQQYIDVLYYRYIKGYNHYRISRILNYSLSSTKRFQMKALEELEVKLYEQI